MSTVTVAIAAYNAEQWIGEAVEAILGQTRPADEIVIVDDGSTDGTARELERFGDGVKLITRENGGCPAAFNTAFSHCTSDYVALCGADDIWEPQKIEWQLEAIEADPAIDVTFADASLFGLTQGTYARPPGTGRLEREALIRALYYENLVCAPSVVIRRSLFERLGPFVERFGADDYEYWMRCLRDGAVFHYDPRIMLRYRRHEDNLSSKLLWMRQCSHSVHQRYKDLPGDRVQVRDVLAADLFGIGRELVDEGRRDEARGAFRQSARIRPGGRAIAWLAVLALPQSVSGAVGGAVVRIKRTLRPA